MKTTRTILSLFSFIAGYLLLNIFFLSTAFASFSRPLPDMAANIICLSFAIAAAVLVWRITANASEGLTSSILIGGITAGAGGFILGFLGQMIFWPDSNIGPIAAIIVTGPIGFLLGLIGGWLFWRIKVKGKN